MNRLSIVLFASLLVAACSGTPGATGGSLPSIDTSQAMAQACDTNSQTSLSGVAGQLRTVGPETDTTQVTDSIDTLIDNLEQVETTGVADTAKDTAITELQAVENALSDPGTAQDTANTAAAALDGLRGTMCS
jgi:hypothetical protein